MSEKRDAGDFVRQVQESTQQYTRDLLKENERLVGLVATLHEKHARAEARAQALEERARAHDQMQTTLLEQISDMEATNRAFSSRYLEVEALNANLANLYVASYRIHGSLDREEVLETLREILINLVGTEEFTIYERQGETSELRPVSSFGVEDARLVAVRLGEPGLGACIARGAAYVPTYDPEATSLTRNLTACVPLRIGERVVGAIVVYRLLAHKPALEESDVELLNLLATHGATSLYCSDLHARARAERPA